MCGIAGIISKNDDVSEIIKLLNKNIKHRGPDDDAYYINKALNIALTSTRLSIIGIKEGAQPKISHSKKILVFFNGEIFNYKELGKKYLNQNIKSDTEVILKLYSKFGITFLEKLNGMFAITILDLRYNKIFLIRDRFGIKPLYYLKNTNTLIFSSEINSIIKSYKKKYTLNYQAVSNFLSLGFVNSPNSIYSEINKLEAGHYIEYFINKKKLIIKKWWHLKLKKKIKKISKIKALSLVENQIKKSIKLWSTSDVPISFLLSGGTDSAILTYFYLKENFHNTHTFSHVFKNKKMKKWNEKKTIDKFIDKFKNTHENLFFNENLFAKDIYKIMNHLGEPFGGGLPSWQLLKKISSKFKVAIAGVGGDELFGNYNRQHKFLNEVKENFYDYENFKKFYFYNKFYLADENFKKKYTNLKFDKIEETSKIYFNKFVKRKNKCSVEKNLSLIDFDLGLPDDYLYYNDMFSMAHSVELRTPYLDHNLVQLAYNLPEKIRTSDKTYKPLLKKISKKYLPKIYLDQPKKGFSVPLSICMRSSMKKTVSRLLSKKNLSKVGIIKEKFYDDFVTPMLKGSNKDISIVWHILMLHLWISKLENKINV